MTARPVRMPLVPGDTGAGVLLVLGLLGAPLYAGAGLALGPGWGWLVATALWAPLAGLAGAVAWMFRPSDATLGPDGLEVHGGPTRGARAPLSSLADAAVHLEEDEHVLRAGSVDLARTGHELEVESLRALAATARAAATGREPPREVDPRVERCGGCAAPRVPVDREEVACPTCGRVERMSEAARAVAGARDAEPVVRDALARLDAWPRAGRVSATLLGAGGVVAVSWPVVGGVGLAAAAGAPLDALDLVTLGAVGVNLAWTLPLRVVFLAADRRAFAWIGCRYAAPPAPLDRPAACRSCAGPLPDPVGRSRTPAVARCAWCDADNVVGLGLVLEAEHIRRGADDLRADAEERERERAGRRRASIGSAVVLAATPLALADLVLRALGG